VLEKTNNGATALHIATRHSELEVVKELLNRNPELIAEKNNLGTTTLHFAAQYGHLEVVKELLNRNPELVLEKTNNGATALHLAAHYGHLEVVQFLGSYFPPLIQERPINQSTTIFNFLNSKAPSKELEETLTLLCALSPMTFDHTPFTLNMPIIGDLKKLVPFIDLTQDPDEFALSVESCMSMDETLLETCLNHLPINFAKENHILSQLHQYEIGTSYKIGKIKQFKSYLDSQLHQYPEHTQEAQRATELLALYNTNDRPKLLGLETTANKLKTIIDVYKNHLTTSLFSQCMTSITSTPEMVQELLFSQEPHVQEVLNRLEQLDFSKIPLGQRHHATSFEDLLKRKALKYGLKAPQ
jgi:hypothetical protein